MPLCRIEVSFVINICRAFKMLFSDVLNNEKSSLYTGYAGKH